jgi:ArsR family transcriptional regulator
MENAEMKKTETQDSLADGLKALGHPARLEIVRQLVMRDRCCGGDFCECLSLAQSTISQHLELLKQTGIVERQQQGTRSIYTLNRPRLAMLSRALKELASLEPDIESKV